MKVTWTHLLSRASHGTENYHQLDTTTPGLSCKDTDLESSQDCHKFLTDGVVTEGQHDACLVDGYAVQMVLPCEYVNITRIKVSTHQGNSKASYDAYTVYAAYAYKLPKHA